MPLLSTEPQTNCADCFCKRQLQPLKMWCAQVVDVKVECLALPKVNSHDVLFGLGHTHTHTHTPASCLSCCYSVSVRRLQTAQKISIEDVFIGM